MQQQAMQDPQFQQMMGNPQFQQAIQDLEVRMRMLDSCCSESTCAPAQGRRPWPPCRSS